MTSARSVARPPFVVAVATVGELGNEHCKPSVASRASAIFEQTTQVDANASDDDAKEIFDANSDVDEEAEVVSKARGRELMRARSEVRR